MEKTQFITAFFVLSAIFLQPIAAKSETEDYTFKLTQSNAAYQFWTTPPSERVFKNDTIPSDTGSEVKVYAAKNEFEPFQIVVKPNSSGNVSVSIGNFGSGITTEIFQVKYINITTATDYLGQTGENPDPLWPIASGDTIGVTAGQNTAFWFSVHVPSTVVTGDYIANVTIGGVTIPVRLHVFNFAIPDEVHVKSQMNFSHNTILTKYGVSGTGSEYWSYVDKMKQFFVDHRLTPKSVLWSGGLTTNGASPYIDYDCNGTLTDPHGIWGFEDPAERYLDGTGLMGSKFSQVFNEGTGFPSFMAVTFQNNDASADQRPSTFCGYTRSTTDWYTGNNPNSSYNQKWFQYITAIQNYLNANGYLDKGYYYFANEPQDQADYDAVAWYSRYLKQAAPSLKLMVSEEPKPEIYNHTDYVGDGQIDIWLPHLGIHFDPVVSQGRLKNHNEESWIYFLKSTYLPRFNAITIDHPGIESKFTGWFLWKYRLRGIAYYQFNNWSSNPWTSPNPYGQNGERFLMYPPSESNTAIAYGANNHRFVPSIRLELMRDGFEDYEYFYLLSGGQQPQPDVVNTADAQVNKVIGMTTSYTRDSEFMYNLRRLIGLKIGGEIASIPDIEPVSAHPRSDEAPGNYYINFQDPNGEPTDNPLVYNGHTYMKVGNDLYDPAVGYGWYRAADVPGSNFYTHWDQWVDPEPKKLLGSAVINDWGREDVFEFDLPNGLYNVTVTVGYRGGNRTHRILIEDVTVIDNEVTNGSWITRTNTVEVKDKKLSLQMGMYGEVSFINFLDIEAAAPAAASLISPSGAVGDSTPTYTWNAANGATWYYLWVNGPAGTLINQWYTAEQANCTGGSCSLTPTTSLADGNYTWWVQTWNAAGYGSWSTGMDFTVVSSPPPAATLVSPSGTNCDTTPIYVWETLNSAAWYYLWVDGPAGNVINQWYTTEQANCTGNTCAVAPTTTLTSGSHSWWLQTWNSNGYGPWSAAKSFTVDPGSAPGAVTLVSPTASAINPPPYYWWYEDSCATWYYLWVDGPSGNVINQWYTAAQANCNGTWCWVTNSTSLPVGTNTWWVQTWNATGYGPWSAGMDFTVPAASPAETTR